MSNTYNSKQGERPIVHRIQAKDRQTQVGKHKGLGHEGQQLAQLDTEMLGRRRDVLARVVSHDDPTEQDRHDARETEALCQQVRRIRVQHQHARLEHWMRVHARVLEQLCRLQASKQASE